MNCTIIIVIFNSLITLFTMQHYLLIKCVIHFILFLHLVILEEVSKFQSTEHLGSYLCY
ncbi:hypothetical protein SAMN02746009_03837 [Hymenobacter psychrotolerans DSM 18569]|uniref:Uncharacterized protein n=1 Tax=Hymenobacter psychrotolerans DSM 18569 TaxID=1121959 RepID=A0A1M7FHG3_9BACT|nr:hypothetical protein SAMN02746009_03837 [Hymenobacter psychrotolerans DSM 18569]